MSKINDDADLWVTKEIAEQFIPGLKDEMADFFCKYKKLAE